jgi:hypothetical protein
MAKTNTLNGWWKFICSLLGSIILSIAGNFVFAKMMQFWAL